MATTTNSSWSLMGGSGSSWPNSRETASSMPQNEIEPSNPTPTMTTTTEGGTPYAQLSPFLSLPSELRHQIYKYCNQTSITLTYVPSKWKSTRHVQLFRHTVQSTLYSLSRTCQLIHTDLMNTDNFPNMHLEMGIDDQINAGPFPIEHCSGFRATYTEVLRYLANRNRADTPSKDDMHSNSGIPSHILHNILRVTIFNSFRSDGPVSSFRTILPNLQGVTKMMWHLYPRELQNLVNKRRPERWVDKVVNAGYRSTILPQCPDTIDLMTFWTVKNFDCLTCFGEVTRLHAVGITVTVSTSTWTVLQVSAKKGTFKDRDRESNQTSRKKHEKRPEFWEGYECQCDFDRMVAWWLGLDVDECGDGEGNDNRGEERQRRVKFGRDYLSESRFSEW